MTVDTLTTEQARGVAARVYCDQDMGAQILDPRALEAIAQILVATQTSESESDDS